MKAWLVRVGKKSKPELVDVKSVDASSAKEAAEKLEGGLVRFWFKDDDHWEFVGQSYLYEVREL